MEVLKESKPEIRNSQYQKSFNPDKLRRKRAEGIIELRKQKRSQQAAKKRALQGESGKRSEDTSAPTEFLVFDLN